MVETRGLIGAIEAGDVMVKTANVRLVDTEYIKNGFVTVKCIGEVAAVKAAVDAASAAAQRVGNLITTHVIPRPAEEIEMIIRKAQPASQVSSSASKKEEPKPVAKKSVETPDMFTTPARDDDEYRAQLDTLTVPQLRTLARDTGGLSIVGREISKANKELLISELMKKRTGA
ncbi:MAG: BMC domain-containing protein [bacterium]